MEPKQKLEIAAQSSQAVLKSLAAHSVSIYDTNDNDDPMNWGVFSGTLVAIGGRIFVATASHCIVDTTSLTRYWILSDSPRQRSGGVPGVVAAWKTPSDDPDVGVLELDPASLSQYASKQACNLERLKLTGLGRPGRICSLVGSPGEYVQEESCGGARGFKAVVISYNSTPIGTSDWPGFIADPAPYQDVNILMHYPSGTNDTTRLDTGDPIALPDPGGMSGGGLWDQGFETNKIWSTDNAFLFGIQIAWFPSERYVWVVQVKHWLQLVHHHYPDLRAEIDGRFPELHT